MLRKCVSLWVVLSFSGILWSVTVSDNFNAPHNYLTDGVNQTIWSGLVGPQAGETADVMDASVTAAGQLVLKSTNAVWAETWNPLGPFLYRMVEGDFVCTVRVTGYQDIMHNNGGIMARAVKTPQDLAGAGEDWVSLDYFPIWSCGNFVRYANDGVRTEACQNGLAFNLHPYLKIQRIGNLFYFSTSADGTSWTAMSCSPLERADLQGVPLQVGLFQATYSGSQGYVAFDDFYLEGAAGLGRIQLGVAREPLEVYENGAAASYTVALEGDTPASDVQIAITGDSYLTIVPSTLTFTPANYQVPQTVQVGARFE